MLRFAVFYVDSNLLKSLLKVRSVTPAKAVDLKNLNPTLNRIVLPDARWPIIATNRHSAIFPPLSGVMQAISYAVIWSGFAR